MAEQDKIENPENQGEDTGAVSPSLESDQLKKFQGYLGELEEINQRLKSGEISVAEAKQKLNDIPMISDGETKKEAGQVIVDEKQAKEAEKVARTRAKREAKEAKQAVRAEKKATKEAEKITRSRAKQEAKEAKQAVRAEKEMAKEAEKAARVASKQETREARQAVEAEEQPEPEPEIQAGDLESQESTEAGQVIAADEQIAEEVGETAEEDTEQIVTETDITQEGTKGVVSDVMQEEVEVPVEEDTEQVILETVVTQEGTDVVVPDVRQEEVEVEPVRYPEDVELIEGELTLLLVSPADSVKMRELQKHLHQVSDLRIVLISGSVDKDTTIRIKLEKPIPIVDVLRGMPPVKEVNKTENDIQVTLG